MKILILTGRFGMGHLKAAEAIKEELTLCHTKDGQKFDIEIIDWIEYLTPRHARSIYNGYSSLIRCNTVFYNLHYKSSENRPITQKPNLIGYVRMNQLIYEKQPDFIISVLACASNAAAYYKALSGSSIPLITCVTDITGHSEWINNYTDAYAVGSEEVRRSFIQKGVPKNQIYVTGIPVRRRFYAESRQKTSASEKTPTSEKACEIFRPKILLMGGGLGLLPKRLDFYRKLDELVPAEMTLITGKNEKMFRKLSGRFENIEVHGYVRDIEKYFLRSDLVITKPGGITTFEAIYAGTPILALNPTMRQEKYNAAFIEAHEIGKKLILKNDRADAERIARLIQNRGEISHYKQQMRRMRQSLASCTFAEIINELTAFLPLGGALHHEIFSFNF